MVQNGPNGRKWSKMVKNGGPDLKRAQRTGLSARRARRTKSSRPEGPKAGPKGRYLEVGARRAPRLLVYYIYYLITRLSDYRSIWRFWQSDNLSIWPDCLSAATEAEIVSCEASAISWINISFPNLVGSKTEEDCLDSFAQSMLKIFWQIGIAVTAGIITCCWVVHWPGQKNV